MSSIIFYYILLINFFIGQIQLLRAPNIGDNKYITQTYFNIINTKRNNTISKFHENIKLNLKFFEYYMQ